MQLWEHKTAAIGVHSENEMGLQGWELVAVAGGIAFYKRAKDAVEGTVENVEHGTTAAVNRVHDKLGEMLDHMRQSNPVMTASAISTRPATMAMSAGDEPEARAEEHAAAGNEQSAEHIS